MPTRRQKQSSQARSIGFTLVELLIVTAVIAILMIGAIVTYLSSINKSYDAIRKRDLNNIKVAFEHYFSDHDCYPPVSILNNCDGPELKPYLDKIPCDPQTKLPYSLKLDTVAGCAQKYFITSDLFNNNDPAINCAGDFYIVTSPNVNSSELSMSCKGQSLCVGGYYGCVQGACVLLSAITKPNCNNLQCTSDCNGHCGNPSWEVSPQPCLP